MLAQVITDPIPAKLKLKTMEDFMKNIKKIFVSALFAIMLVSVYNPTEAMASRPLENYADCALGCISSYDAWTIRRSLCAADCFINLVSDVIQVLSPL